MESATPLAHRKQIGSQILTGVTALRSFSSGCGANTFPTGAAAEFGG
jgi:hypothetical protein